MTQTYGVNKATVRGALVQSGRGTPVGAYFVDPEALKRARSGTPTGEYHVSIEAVRSRARGCPPPRFPATCRRCGSLHAAEPCPMDGGTRE